MCSMLHSIGYLGNLLQLQVRAIGNSVLSPRSSLASWDSQTSVGEMKQTYASRELSMVLNWQQLTIQWQCWELSVKYVVLKCANRPCAQSMSFLDGHGVLAACPAVSLAPIVSGSALLLWIGEAGGGKALWNVPQALSDIKEGHWNSQSWQS